MTDDRFSGIWPGWLYSMDMGGIHRGAADSPAIAARKTIRWLVTVITVVAVLSALLALIIYLVIFVATDLELWGAAWLVGVTNFIQTVIRRPRGPADRRWFAWAWLLAATWNVFSAFAHQRRWPPSQLHSLDFAGYGVGLVSLALAGVALVIAIRSGTFGRRRPAADTQLAER